MKQILLVNGEKDRYSISYGYLYTHIYKLLNQLIYNKPENTLIIGNTTDKHLVKLIALTIKLFKIKDPNYKIMTTSNAINKVIADIKKFPQLLDEKFMLETRKDGDKTMKKEKEINNILTVYQTSFKESGLSIIYYTESDLVSNALFSFIVKQIKPNVFRSIGYASIEKTFSLKEHFLNYIEIDKKYQKNKYGNMLICASIDLYNTTFKSTPIKNLMFDVGDRQLFKKKDKNTTFFTYLKSMPDYKAIDYIIKNLDTFKLFKWYYDQGFSFSDVDPLMMVGNIDIVKNHCYKLY